MYGQREKMYLAQDVGENSRLQKKKKGEAAPNPRGEKKMGRREKTPKIVPTGATE